MNAHFGLLPQPPVPAGMRKLDKGTKKELQAAAALELGTAWARNALPWEVAAS